MISDYTGRIQISGRQTVASERGLKEECRDEILGTFQIAT